MMNPRGCLLAILVYFAAAANACSGSSPPSASATADAGACPAGQMACGSTCADTSGDAQNCGACGNACPAGAHCDHGTCACGGSLTLCGGMGGASCVDTSSSTASCGTCGNACAGDEACVGGLCVCPTDFVVCGGTCTNPRTSAQHCGATQGCGEGDAGIAGAACPSDRYCGQGACQPCETFAQARTQTSSGRVPLSSPPVTIGTADLNRDGKVDLVAGSQFVDILLGHGDGTFEPVQQLQQNVYGGNGGSSLTFADIDGDGATDLVIPSGPGAAVFFGYGDGAFDPTPLFVSMPDSSRPTRVGDFNGDGRPDLVQPNRFGPGFSVALNKGSRTFGPATSITTSDESPVAVTTADFNGDGKTDIALADDSQVNYVDQPSDVEVLLGNGDGTFRPSKVYPAGASGRDITTGDVNHDGKTDIISDNQSSIAIFLGNGDGTFASATHLVTFPDTSFVLPTHLTANAGVLDLVTSTREQMDGTSLLEARIGAGDGTFFPAQVYSGGGGGIAVADVNGDGRPDILAGEQTNHDVIVYLGTKQPGCP